MIVGIVLAVVLVVFVVLLLLFARATGRWCFADDEEANDDEPTPDDEPSAFVNADAETAPPPD